MRTSFLSIGLLGLVLIGISFNAGYGQAKKENLEEALQKAKDEFRSKIDEIEVKLILALEQRIESARKAGDKKTLDLATAERDQFNADGTLPKSVEKASQTFQRQSAAARKKLELVYRNQIKEYVKRSEDAKADELQAELDAFVESDRKGREPEELIRNGGFEDRLDGEEKQKWVEVQGRWELYDKPDLPAQSGSSCLWPTDSPVAELMQEVDISRFAPQIDNGKLNFEFVGYVRGAVSDGEDSGRIILELLDGKEKKALVSFDSGEVLSFERWKKIEVSKTINKGARWIRVRLLSKRNQGIENNSYYDGLSLGIVPRNKSGSDSSK